jgi:putative salt-induced outer membrane protein YdiY
MASILDWRTFWCVLLLLCGATLANVAMADEVVLMDGARLTGSVVHKAGEKLTFKTAYAGEIQINWSEVRTLSTENPVDVVLVGEEEPLREVLELSGEGGTRILGMRVPLVDVVYINPKPDQIGKAILYSGNVKASASYVRGNTRGRQTYFDADFTGRSAKYRYALLGKIHSAREGPEQDKTAESWLASGNFDGFLDDKNFLYVRGSVERDRFKDVDRRSTIGVGYGFQLIETQRTNVSVRGGIDFVRVNHVLAQDERYPALGWGVQATHKLTSTVELFHSQEGFQNLEDSDRTIIRSRTGARVPLFGRLNFSVQLNVDWERQPATDRKPTDYVWLLGLGYSW